ncbi:hypothetical protein DWF04_015660 [Cereibacter sphaeroides f. sp. denitrificans]|nr:hypothetical protein DWF04_16260 [Cereibacter sphaeroides f. sp. denitrificans]
MATGELNFLEFIQTFRRGELLEQGDQMLNELVDAVQLTGGKGSLTITLPLSMNKAGQIECTPKVDVKKPRRAMGSGIYYATNDGRLTRRDPSQSEMFDELEGRRGRGE